MPHFLIMRHANLALLSLRVNAYAAFFNYAAYKLSSAKFKG
jgi:hypothetical protein